MPSTHEDIPAWTPPVTGYPDLAELELRKLEDIGPDSTRTAYATARGFAALAYAVLALHDTREEQCSDLSNTLVSMRDSLAGTDETLSDLTHYSWRIAEMIDRPSLWRRIASRLRLSGRDGAPETL